MPFQTPFPPPLPGLTPVLVPTPLIGNLTTAHPCGPLWLPTVEVVASSTTHHGYYPVVGDTSSFSALYTSPHVSSISISAYLLPTGGLVSHPGIGGVGKLPQASYTQARRAAESHALLVQTPDVHPNMATLAVLVQAYDKHGSSDVSWGSMAITATLLGFDPLRLVTYSKRGPGGTRRYYANVPRSWFEAAEPLGSIVTVTSSLSGKDSHTSSCRVHGDPTWFGQRPSAAGVAAYMTSDTAGRVPLETMRAGVRFHLQLYAHTGGFSMSAFEVKLIEDPAVCTLVPTSGTMSADYVGTLQGELSGIYSTELLKRSQDLEDPSVYFTKYSRFGKLSYLQSSFGHLGYVSFDMVGSGSCLTSATVTSFYSDGGTTWIAGVSNGDAVTLHGNVMSQYVDTSVGVFGQLVTTSPVLNMAFLSGLGQSVSVRTLVFSSDDTVSSSMGSVTISEAQESGSVAASVSNSGFSHMLNFTLMRLPTPTLQVDDSELQALPGSCSGFQSTRLHARSGGVDIARLLTFQVTAPEVLAIDTSIPARPVVTAVGPGTGQVYVKEVGFANVTVAVSTSVVGISSLSAGVVTSVDWSSSSSAAGPFVPTARHMFVSEASSGWVYVGAVFDDGSSFAVESPVTARLGAPLNQSVAVTYPALQPPMVSVLVGASSVCGWIEATTCLGSTFALLNLTVPPPVAMSLSSNRETLVPQSNVASEFSGHYAFTDLVANVEFADGSTVAMQTDTRMVYSISAACGTFATSGRSKRLTIVSTCHSSSVTVRAQLTIGTASVQTIRTFTIVWLASLELRLYFRDSATPFTSSTLKHRYACSDPQPEFHTLKVKAYGTLTSGTSAFVHNSVAYSASGGTLSGSGSMRTLSVSSLGEVVIGVSASPNPDNTSDTISLTAVAEADSYTFEWALGLSSSTVYATVGSSVGTSMRLHYSSGYVETISNGDRPSLITFSSSDETTLLVSSTGMLQPQTNSPNLSPLQVAALLCDGQNVSHSGIYINLQHSSPVDYDLGNSHGAVPTTWHRVQSCVSPSHCSRRRWSHNSSSCCDLIRSCLRVRLARVDGGQRDPHGLRLVVL
jgi:hypothetical protein